MEQTYDISKSYQENYDRGPVFQSSPPPDTNTDSASWKTFLGLPVRSRLGIAAGLLLNSRWILDYARRGFDILTYKTVRSVYRPCYPPPNWVFVEDANPSDGPVYAVDPPATDPREISSAVCFGMPSMSPEVWRKDVARARAGLADGQLLVVSVVASPQAGTSEAEVMADFRQCAEWAAEAGADVVEANFSCPNVCSSEGTIYLDAAFSGRVAAELRKGLGSKPLLLKVGHMKEVEQMRDFLRAVHEWVDGVTMVNGMTRPILHKDGRPVFGEDRVRAGVLGRAIHQPSLAQVKLARSLIAGDGLDLRVAAVGGVAMERDLGDFFEAGAEAVLMGSAPMYCPDLAVRAKAGHPEW